METPKKIRRHAGGSTGESFLIRANPRSDVGLPDLDVVKQLPTQPSYIVPPTVAGERISLVYQNVGEGGKGGWSIYERGRSSRRGAEKDRWLEQERFLKEVAQPNIEKYRKSDARIELVDADGRPLRGVEYKVMQTRQAFKFGCSLPFFEEVEGEPFNDYKPDPVTPEELRRFRETTTR